MLTSPLLQRLVALALEEDLAFGDLTSELTIPPSQEGRARIIAREELVVCGGELLELIAREAGGGLAISLRSPDGDLLASGGCIAEVHGATRTLLALERTFLNFLQRMCGVATYTRAMCNAAAGLTILDTRKTLPGWRYLDKYAVRVGGGRNHRFSLGDMVLVKNNHIDGNPGGMRAALATVVERKPLYMPWEVEVRDLAELAVALEFEPTVIMLDNFDDAAIREGMKLIANAARRPLIEVSGGVTPERFAALRELGVDAASMGALTTQARNVDISMRIERVVQ